MDVPKATIVDAKKLLERHLERIDPRTCGRGHEPGREKARDDPMAWGLYGRAFVHLWRQRPDPAMKATAQHCHARLKSLRSPTDPGHLAWGLPYPWKHQPASHPYAITTAMCGDFLLDLHDQGLLDVRDDVRRSATWLVDALPWESRGQGACPHFAPQFPYLATNVASRVGAFLLRARAAGLIDAHSARRGSEALQYVLGEEIAPGLWIYGRELGEERPILKVDNLHTGYVLEGLLEAHGRLSWVRHPRLRRRLRTAAERGAKQWFSLHYAPEPPIERLHLVPPEEEPRWRRRADTTFTPLTPTYTAVLLAEETRSWALGTALTVVALQRDPAPEALERVVRAAKAVARPDGGFSYRTSEPSRYVRHEAHLFYGLARVNARWGAVNASSR